MPRSSALRENLLVEAPASKLVALQTLRHRLAELDAEEASLYVSNPAGWIDERQGEFFWSKQIAIADSVRDHRRTAVKSCHDVGKSFSASRLIAWWLDTHPPGEAFVVSTAPTFKQVRAVLWREVGRAHRKGHLPGRVNQTEWWMNIEGGEELVAFGSKPADWDPGAFQGIHAKYVLVVIDEAGAVPESLWIAAGALVTNEDSRILAIGNPDDPTAHFARVCQPDSGWNVLQIRASESPNFTGEEVPEYLKPLLISQVYLDELASDVGIGSAIWQSKVEGEFPIDAEDSVVRSSALAKCRIGSDDPHTEEQLLPVELGVDVGGSETGDRTVIRERRGVLAGQVWRLASSDSNEIAQAIVKAIVESGATMVKIDSIGIGWGVAGHLTDMRNRGEHGAQIVKVNVGSASSKPNRFPKLRDELWWEVGRNLCERQGWDLSNIDDRTAADLLAPKWSPDPQGRIKIEPKDKTRERLGRSPDDADALLLAYYSGSSAAKEWIERMADEGAIRSAAPDPTGLVPTGPTVVPDMTAGARQVVADHVKKPGLFGW